MRLILVPTDMSETAAHALRYASALCERFDAHLLVVYSDPFLPPLDFGVVAPISVRRDDLMENAREQLELHVEQNVSAAVPYDARVVAQAPVEAILEQACETGADLIVMGTHGRSGVSRFILGSITEAVIPQATAPVIAVNAACLEQPKINKVVSPISFTPASLEAVRYAATMADASSLLLFRGVEGTEVPDTINEVIALQDWIPNELRSRAEMRVVPYAASALEIAEFAKANKADLIALGVPSRFVQDLLHLSPCPVLTINERTVRMTVPERQIPLSAAGVR